MSTVVNHVAQAQGLLVSQFRPKPNMRALVGAFVAPLQELEYVYQQLRYLRWLNFADGAQLDQLGDMLGEPRAQRPDVAYKVALEAAILRNSCDGTPNKVIKFVQTLTRATEVFYTESGVSDVEIIHNGTRIDDLLTQLRDIAPVGVGLIYLSQPGDSTPEIG